MSIRNNVQIVLVGAWYSHLVKYAATDFHQVLLSVSGAIIIDCTDEYDPIKEKSKAYECVKSVCKSCVCVHT